MRLSSNVKGFSLVEVVVAVAILGVVALAGATLATIADKSTQYSDRKQELLSFGGFLIENLKNTKSCSLALTGNNLAGANPNSRATGNGNSQKQITQAGGRSLYINDIEGLQMTDAQGAMTGTSFDPDLAPALRQILPRRLQINSITLADGVTLNTTASSTTYLADVYLDAEEINGMHFKPIMVGAITVTTDAAGAVTSCEGLPATAVAAACQTGLGCTLSNGSCQCIRTQQVCLGAGSYPTKMDASGFVKCESLGSDPSVTNPSVPAAQCGPNQFLVGISLSNIKCAPVPTTCPAGTSTSGLGASVTGLINCQCANAGETWNGSSCVAPPTPTPTPTPIATPTPTPTPTPTGPMPTPVASPTNAQLCPDGVTTFHQEWGAVSSCSNSSGTCTQNTCTYNPAANGSYNNCGHVPSGSSCIAQGLDWICQGSCGGAASCTPGLTWNGSSCVAGQPASSPTPSTNKYCYTSSTQACPACSGQTCLPSQSGQAMPNGSTCSCINCPSGSSTVGTGAATNIPTCSCDAATPNWNGTSCTASVTCPAGSIYVASMGGCRPNPYQCAGGNPSSSYCSTVCGQQVASDNAAGMNCSYSCSFSTPYYYGLETCQ